LLPSQDICTVALLGGSFNPAHAGHVHISKLALKHLKAQQVWWLVSPQNPMKSTKNTAPLAQRLYGAQKILKPHRNIIATDLERQFGTQYSIGTIKAIQHHFPRTHFTWIMGADNLLQLDQWDDWQGIMQRISIAVMDRAPYGMKALSSKAVIRYRQHRILSRDRALLLYSKPPCWVYLPIKRNSLSSTQIRAAGKSVD